MIEIGLTGWGDHPSLYPTPELAKHKLKSYSAHFPIVELDSSFYAIPSARNVEKWVKETPERFGFIVKAYQGMTGHTRGKQIAAEQEPLSELLRTFREVLEPMRSAGKLKAVLFQYPPWFRCEKNNVQLLRYTKDQMADWPCALEFRNQSWFRGEMRQKTIDFMKSEQWMHSVCDEPQAGEGSIPIVPVTTYSPCTIVRFHGRNTFGWLDRKTTDWRAVRYLYRYSPAELAEWKERLVALEQTCEQLCVVFNNNSGGDAADNAKQLMEQLNIQYTGLHPRQLEWFDEW
ncbi:DUF72 domain-containing protein [Marinicrinis sediminis]|uniref:DUF72 domain-containing protein n=1 Tax=Marinicrinis sediminis TaxID=1652465 RepID=A0ABW5REH1_9BACL